jgi:prephenate dehydrogenase
MASTSPTLPFRGVFIVGTGLLGTSIGLALRELGVSVWLDDLSSSALALATDYGAGVAGTPDSDEVDLVVVATPPDVTASVVSAQLTAFPESLVIDVASVKGSILKQLRSAGADLSRYVGTHPMAGREKGGPTSARVDLFTGRPWVICSHEESDAPQLGVISALVSALGGGEVRLSPDEHDRAVAVVSHLPQVVSSAVAAELNGSHETDLNLAGQGLRDVTRIAGSDSALWQQILSHNASEVASLVRHTSERLTRVADALDDLSASGAKRAVAELLDAGASGAARIPGKHGRSARFASLTIVIDDKPGQLAALLTEIGEVEVNLEDMTLEHSPGASVGFVELFVEPSALEKLGSELDRRGWRIAGERS